MARILIETITVNQWHVKENATLAPADRKPVICVNTYEYLGLDGTRFGDRVAATRHYHQKDMYQTPEDILLEMVYDPDNKTPCGASCWHQRIYKET